MPHATRCPANRPLALGIACCLRATLYILGCKNGGTAYRCAACHVPAPLSSQWEAAMPSQIKAVNLLAPFASLQTAVY